MAVKTLTQRAQDSKSLYSLLARLSLELRILVHESLRENAHIVDLLALYLDGTVQLVSLSLVLEYSSLGNLTEFLMDRAGTPSDIPVPEKIALANNIASGLTALHDLRICHGDVKTQNALVFAEENGFIAKVSDFGSAVFPETGISPGQVMRPAGTPMLTAPELYDLPRESFISIDAAMQTDVFSFGLLLWEVLKGGQSYFDIAWLLPNQSEHEDFLRDLPRDGLITLGLDFVASMRVENKTLLAVSQVLSTCLRTCATSRGVIADVATMLCHGTLVNR